LWEIMSDLAVANLGMENRGVESLWAEPAGLTATARDALEKAVARVPPAWLLPPADRELLDRPGLFYRDSHHHIILLRLLMG
jgi:hypothetical protein